MKIKKTIIIRNSQGLHARPAALFVQIANKFNSDITVSKDGEKVNGKSIMGLMMLAAGCGSEIEIEAEGEDAARTVDQLEQFLQVDYSESEGSS